MSSSPIDILKSRLAKGDISVAEYQSVLEQLTNTVHSGVAASDVGKKPSEITSAIQTASAKIMGAISGPKSYDIPTDAAPLEINKRFVIYGSFFEYKRNRFEFAEIVSIGANFDTQTINLVSSSSTVVTLVLANAEKILLTGMSMITSGRTNNLVRAAYHILSEKTLAGRYKRYVDELETRGAVVLNENQLLPFGRVSLSQDGCLVKGSLRVNLRLSAKNSSLIIGTTWGSSLQGGVNPYEVVAGENGTSAFSRRIKFDVIFDRDIVFDLIRKFSGIT